MIELSFPLCFRYVIMELIETEKDYVKDLGLIVEVLSLLLKLII